MSLQEAEALADFSSGEALRPRQLGLDPPPFPDPGHLHSVPTAGSPASIFLFRTKRPMQQQDRTPPSPSSSLETKARRPSAPTPLLPKPTTRPTSQARGCCLAFWEPPGFQPLPLSFHPERASPSPLSVRKTGIEEPHPALPATLRKPTRPRTETRRAIKAGVNEHQRSAVPQLGGQARLAGEGPVLSL